MNAEAKTRAALAWAYPETVLRTPPDKDAWRWDSDDLSLHAEIAGERWKFHVAGERRRSGYFRIAVLSVTDGQGKATWEAEIPGIMYQTHQAGAMPDKRPEDTM